MGPLAIQMATEANIHDHEVERDSKSLVDLAL